MSEQQAYYDTTGLDDKALAERIAQAESQEERARRFFEARPQLRLTPFEVQERIFPNTPVTSVRRALSNLTDAGVLEKTDEMREGRFGEPNHTWTLAADPGEQAGLFDSPSQPH